MKATRSSETSVDFNGLHSIISQKIDIAVKTSDTTQKHKILLPILDIILCYKIHIKVVTNVHKRRSTSEWTVKPTDWAISSSIVSVSIFCVNFCWDGISNEGFRVRMLSKVEGMYFIVKVHMREISQLESS
jgi:hypothetical protein